MLEALRRITPEWFDTLTRRYNVLHAISVLQPVGRRALTGHLRWSERKVRSEIDALKDNGLVCVRTQGMTLSEEGAEALSGIGDIMRLINELGPLEEQVTAVLGVLRVRVVAGDCERDASVLREMARAASQELRGVLHSSDIIAVTGGSTMAAVAYEMEETTRWKDLTFIPARGGMGRFVERQANTIAAVMARKLGGNYRLLHVPDRLRGEARRAALEDPETREVLCELRKADIFMYGIGRGDEMARRRNLPEEVVALLRDAGAVAEAYGYYFNAQGKSVYTVSNVGLTLEHLDGIANHIGVAGGAQKAEAIMAVARHNAMMTLVIDEAAARRIVSLQTGEAAEA